MKMIMTALVMLFLCSFSVLAINLFDDTHYRALIADRKGYLPGDILTVIVLETSNAQTSADLSSGKDIETALKASYNKKSYKVGLDMSGSGRANAKTARNGKIKAALTVRIKDIFPNATYLIEGRQMITINGEQQTILLSGIVRQEDISAQNTILSTRLADAQITYTGNGSVSNSQRYNYAYKLLSFMGLV